jgi:SSS family solute:Na+ symporter
MTLGIIVAYLVLVLAIGWWSQRSFRGTGVDYFVATRTIGAFLLLMSLFGTNMTAFSLLGASGEAYRRGIGVFALMASSTALVTPFVFLTLAPRVWALGKRHGYLTQVQLVRDRWGSERLGLALFAFLVALLVPYLLIGIKGGGLTVSRITDGSVPEWAGSLAITLVVLAYVTAGGLRGTAWANAAQTVVFMVLGAVTFWIVVRSFGGLEAAFGRVAQEAPELLVRGERIRPLELLSYMAIPLSVAGFPHIYLHWLTARSVASFRLPVVAFPLCVAAVWLPSVALGVLGSVDFPGLSGPAASSILIQMIAHYAPGALAGLLAAGVLAAVMSSLDSQTLALSNMFTHDIVKHYGFHDNMSDRLEVLAGRGFVACVLASSFLLSLVIDPSIFRLGIWAFSGFAALAPLFVAALFWRRSTGAGAGAALATTVVLWVAFLARGWSEPGYTVAGSGLMPVVVMLAGSAVALVVVSTFTRPPSAERLERFFPAAESSR